MPTLLTTSEQIRSGLQRVKVANQTKHELAALQERITEWDGIVKARATLKHKAKVIDPTLLARTEISSTDVEVTKLVDSAKELLQGGADVQTLARENVWTRLTELAKKSNELIRSAAQEEWKTFLETLGNIEAPSALEARMLKTPANQEVLTRYREHFAKTQPILRLDLPASESDKATLIAAVEAIRQLKDQLKSSAPEVVRLFLRAIENGGASLSMATPEVLEWIRANDDQNRFVIKPKGAQSWR
jgi:hypothetical protein